MPSDRTRRLQLPADRMDVRVTQTASERLLPPTEDEGWYLEDWDISYVPGERPGQFGRIITALWSRLRANALPS